MTVKPIPDGYHAVTPYLLVEDVKATIEFLEKAFGAVVTEKLESPMGIMHAEVRIRDSVVMMGQAGGERKPMPAMLYIYVEDIDKVYEQAVKSGGTSIQEPEDQFYGDRVGAVKDSQSNQWWIATHKEDLTESEIVDRAKEAFAQKAKA